MQAGGLAALSPEGRQQTDEQVSFYLENARIINDGLKELGITTYGGGNAPYVWLKTPNGLSSWDFFDKLLNECFVVGTPWVPVLDPREKAFSFECFWASRKC